MAKFNFVEDTTRFNLQNAYSLALAAELAYRDEQNVKKTVMKDWGGDACRFFDVEGTQGFAMSTDKLILVAFRGTEPGAIEDWLTDLTFDLVDGPLEGKVHEGFSTALDKVWSRVERTIAQFRAQKAKSLWFTGHSLGAGLATLAAARLLDAARPVDGLYTFGQPRTGDQTFARNFNLEFKAQAFRFVNNNDVITRVPPRSFGYRHLGTFQYFTESGNLVDDISWWNRFMDRLHGRIDDVLEWGTDGIKDHNMAEYRRLVQKALQDTKKKK